MVGTPLRRTVAGCAHAGAAASATACVLLIALAATTLPSARGGVARLGGTVAFGVGDENPSMFEDPRFGWLGVRYARLIVPWDVVRHRPELGRAAAWLAGAQAAGVQPLVSFNESVSRPNTLPSGSAYARAVRAFMHRFPWVTHYQTWDEENQASEPTSRDPARAASFFNWLSGACSKCTVTAADLLDGPSMASWVRRFLRYAHHPSLWGLHPYYELNYGGHEQLSLLARTVGGDIWLTESGLPVWRYVRAEQQFRFTNDHEQQRAARRLLAMTRLDRRVSRVYYYQWRSWIDLAVPRAQFHRHRHVSSTWDSGLLNPDCSIRPIFVVIARALGRNAAHAPRARRANHGLACVAAGGHRHG